LDRTESRPVLYARPVVADLPCAKAKREAQIASRKTERTRDAAKSQAMSTKLGGSTTEHSAQN
jgi:hypothetical protein